MIHKLILLASLFPASLLAVTGPWPTATIEDELTHGRIWRIRSHDGKYYLSTIKELFHHTGKYWDVLSAEGLISARVIDVDKNGRIWVGGISNVGYIENEKYHSLNHLAEESFGSYCFNVFATTDGAYFAFQNKVFLYWNNQFIKIAEHDEGLILNKVSDEEFILQKRHAGADELLTLRGKTLEPLATVNLEAAISSTVRSENRFLFSTNGEGLFELVGQHLEAIEDTPRRITRFISVGDSWIFGTLNQGVVIHNHKAKERSYLTVENGLKSNTVFDVYFDKERAWVATDGGVSYFTPNSGATFQNSGALAYFDADWAINATEITQEREERLKLEHPPSDFLKAPNGIIWSDSTGIKFLSSDTEKHSSIALPHRTSAIQPSTTSDHYYFTSYKQLVLFKLDEGELNKTDATKIEGILPLPPVEQGDFLWIATQKGLVKTSQNGKDAQKVKFAGFGEWVQAIRHSSGPLFISENGNFKYDIKSNNFIEISNLNIPANSTQILQSDTGDFYAVGRAKGGSLHASKRAIGKITKNGNSYQWKELKIDRLNSIGYIRSISFSNENLYISGKNKVLSVNTSEYIEPHNPNSPQVTANFLSHAYQRFSFQQAAYEHGLEYSSYVPGYENNWSDFERRTEREYTNLPPAEYTLHVRSRDAHGNLSAISQVNFRVEPELYETATFWILTIPSALLFVGLGLWRHDASRKRESMREAVIKARYEMNVKNAHQFENSAHLAYEMADLAHMESGSELSKQTKDAVGSLKENIQSLLDYNRAIHDNEPVEIEPLELSDVVANIIQQFQNKASAKNLTLENVVECAQIKSNAFILEEVIGNLISNAIRYTDIGHVLVTSQSNRNTITVRVIDSGKGIAEEHREMIFAENFSASKRVKGNGIGLNIALERAKKINAKVYLEKSTLGQGSTFAFEFEAARVKQLQKNLILENGSLAQA